MKTFLGITWSVSNRHGWGIYGLNLLKEIFRKGEPFPICFQEIIQDGISQDLLSTFKPSIDFHYNELPKLLRAGKVSKINNCLILHSMGNQLRCGPISQDVQGESNVGILFSEDTNISDQSLEEAKRLDAIVCGSTWNANVLKHHGIENVKTIFQGVDTKLFRPLPKKGLYGEKFTIFSGGKLEFRKGQDIVLEAFKLFSIRHPDAVLVTAWQNLWPSNPTGLENSPHVTHQPEIGDDGYFDIKKWALDHGIPEDKFIDLGFINNHAMLEQLREIDLGIFPNRCEGGTNLVAMEAMASGIPCIIAKNTGQIDLTNENHCFVLHSEGQVNYPGTGTEGWGESSIDEVVELMEEAYQNRRAARQIGLIGAEFIHKWSWRMQINKLLEYLKDM